MKEILTIKNLKKHFPVKNAWGTDVALVKALDGVDLKIESGKTFGIVGESGCGKTTLMRTLLRLVEPTSGWVILYEEIIIAPYSSIDLIFDANYNSDMTSFYFDIEPVFHNYDNKNYIFNVYRNQILGDVNNDETLNVLDVVILVNVILGNSEESSNADVNLDGTINILDVVTLINLILS